MPSLNIINLLGVIFVQEMKMKKVMMISCENNHTKISFDAIDSNGFPIYCPLCDEMFLVSSLKEQIKGLDEVPVDEVFQER